ncbi:MAG: TonB-dependent receptor [Bacteroidetes bacterium]|nr:MAG: TonB-dependent receptor [Bacteroidota bacterium]
MLMRYSNAFTLLMFLLLPAWTLFGQRGTVSGNVSDELGALPGATILVVEMGTGTTTDFDGNFTMELDAGTYTLRASYVGYSSADQSVTVNAGETTEVSFVLEQGINVDEVVVLGSRSAPRTQLETAVPVDVIGPTQLKNTAQYNVGQILQYAAPSFHSTQQTISDGTDHIDPAALRGLGPDQTLVLINGKRRHTSALLNVNGTVGRGTVGTDLNAIPAAAIERIEILRDGAAAQYGSDAIAGVINIVLKEQTNLVTVNAQTGVTLPNAFGGPDPGNVPADLVPEFDNDGEIYQLSSNFGFDIGQRGGFVNVTAEYTQRGSVNRSGNYTGSIYPDGYINAKSDDEFFRIVQENTGFNERQVMEIGASALRDAGAFLNAALPIGNDGAEVYGNLGFNYRNGLARGFYRFPATQARVVPQLWPDGFSPQIETDILDNSFTIGVRGEIGGWNVDLSQTRGTNEFKFTVKNSNNASMGTRSPTSAFAGGFSYSQNTTNVDFSRNFDIGFPFNVAYGGEFRLENYQIFPGEEASYINGGAENLWIINGDSTFVAGAAGIQVFPGFQPQNALDKNRNSTSLYADLEFEFTEQLLLGIAGRYENYSDFGDDFNWKIAARYKITPDISIRSAFSTGFRAPSLHQIYFNNLSTQFVTDPVTGDQVPVQVGTFNNQSPVARAFGIAALKPETSTNFSAGITARILDNLSLTIDGYLIDIDDRIVISGRFSPSEELAGGIKAGDILTPLGAGAAQFFTNAVSTQTKGIDVVASYRVPLGQGRLNFTLAGNFTETEVDRNPDGTAKINTPPLLEGKEDVLFNREEISRIEVAQPKSKVLLSALYEVGNFSVLLRATRFGEITYIHPSDGDPANWTENSFTGQVESRDQVFGAKVVPDLELGYRFSNHLRWTVGIHNFTNTFPDMHQHSGNVSSGRFLFSRRVQQFGVRGMYIYTKLGLAF